MLGAGWVFFTGVVIRRGERRDILIRVTLLGHVTLSRHVTLLGHWTLSRHVTLSGHWTLSRYWTLSTRHETLLRPWNWTLSRHVTISRHETQAQHIRSNRRLLVLLSVARTPCLRCRNMHLLITVCLDERPLIILTQEGKRKKERCCSFEQIYRTMGLISADRSNKATLLLTIPRSIKVVCNGFISSNIWN